jgi:glyoxylase-like metal-dependent hydrolase (beta-lactamase superfamily II)
VPRFAIKTLIYTPFEENTYLLVDNKEKKCLIIDPGCDLTKIQESINSQNLTLEAIILTHGHFDHNRSVDELVSYYNVKVYLNLADDYLIKNKGRGHINTEVTDLPIGKFKISEFELETYLAPGHTPGSTLIKFEALNALFSGDVLFNQDIGRTDFEGGDAQAMKHTLSFISKLDNSYKVYPGHNETTTIKNELNTISDYLLRP